VRHHRGDPGWSERGIGRTTPGQTPETGNKSMIVAMQEKATEEQIDAVINRHGERRE
jgi:hypothetical protein